MEINCTEPAHCHHWTHYADGVYYQSIREHWAICPAMNVQEAR